MKSTPNLLFELYRQLYQSLIHTLKCWVLSKVTSSTFFCIFWMTRTRIKPRSHGQLANTLTIMPMGRYCRKYYIYTKNEVWNAISSRRRSYRYCCMDALLGGWLNGWRRSSTAIIQECCEQYWTGPGGNTPHGANCTATDHLSRKLYKLDEPDMPDTAGEAKTRS